MATEIITLDDTPQTIQIISSFMPYEQITSLEFIDRCDDDGSVIENKTCIINDYINNY